MNQRRLRAMQEQFMALARLETEYELARLLHRYDDLGKQIGSLRKQALDALVKGDINKAERLTKTLVERVTRFLVDIHPQEQSTIEGILRQAAKRGAQSVDLAPAMHFNPDMGFDGLAKFLEGSEGVNLAGAEFAFQYGRISRDVQKAIMQRVYSDGLNLSRRLHTRLGDNIKEFNRLVAEGLREGRGAIQLGKQLAELRVTDPRVPRYITDLQRAMHTADQRATASALRKAMKMVDRTSDAALKQGPLGMRTAVRNVVHAAQQGSADLLDEAIEQFIERKIRYHAIVIARTEANNAFTEGHNSKAADAPYVIGTRWHLSDGRPGRSKPCMCEEYASQDWHNLGAGVFPKGEVPQRPHPNCMCYFTDVVDTSWFLSRMVA